MKSPFHISGQDNIDPEKYELKDSVQTRPANSAQVEDSLLNDARQLFTLGNLDAAELRCFWQMEQYGPTGECLHILGTIALRRGQHSRAARRMESAVKFASKDGIIRAHFAETLRQAGDVAKAITEGREAVALAPQEGETHNCLGLAFLDNKQFDLAVRAFENATKLNPSNAGFWNNLGSTLRTVDHLPDSIDCYRKAIGLAPENASYHANLAGALVEDCQHHAAIEHYNKAIMFQPNDSENMNHLGQVYDELGQADTALHWFRRAIVADKDAVPAYVNLAIHHEKELTEEESQSIDRILDLVKLTEKQEAALRFAKAHLLDKQKNYAGATQQFRQANLRQKQWHESRGEGYSMQKHEQFVDSIIRIFTPEFLASAHDWGSTSLRPVFIIGLPRSGTTLTEQILAAHPDIYGAGELRLASSSFEALPNRLKMQVAPADCVPHLTSTLIPEIATDYLQKLSRYNSTAQRVIDKMPENYMHIGWLATLFPNAKFIYCTRDLRDIAVSCLITSFRAVKWSNDDDFLIHRFQQHRRIMDHWTTVLPDRILTVSYEEIVEDRESQTRQMLNWIGLPWHDTCLDHTQTQGIVRTASVSQARQPMYKSSVARWNQFEPFLEELLERLNNQSLTQNGRFKQAAKSTDVEWRGDESQSKQ